MRNLADIKRKFFIFLGLLLVVDLVLAVYLLWPGSSSSAQRAEEERLQQQYRSLGREVAPLKGIDLKLLQTRADIKTFQQDRIPNHWSQISAELAKLTQETGVSIQGVHYTIDKPDKTDLPDLQRLEIETSVSGEYAKVARFVNALEQDKLMFIIKQISLNSQPEGGVVTLQIRCETFLKETA